ncbi:MAG: lytic transglycosylase domain-containing protein [Actinomycetota bacterium]
MIADIQARMAAIEARFGVNEPIVVHQEPTTTTGVGGAAGAGGLASMWAQSMQQAMPPVGRPQNGIGNTGGVSNEFDHLFREAGARHGVDPALLKAVAWTESNFRPDAVSHAGAQGLMQIMPGTADGLGVNPMDPPQAVDGAARYLRQQLDRFGDLRLALAAYNAGPGAVEQHGGVPPYDETIGYVAKVVDRYQRLANR